MAPPTLHPHCPVNRKGVLPHPHHRSCTHVCSWFCRKLSRDLAENALIRARHDCFLIRENEAQGGYTLSLRLGGAVKHFRIIKRECSGRYCLNGSSATFASLPSMVEYYSHNCVTSCGELLIHPCPIEVTTPTLCDQ